MGCTWDTTLVEQIFTVATREARARGTRQVLSPVLDLALDPRWGRTEECYSEDPYLVSRLGMAAVFGFQGREKIIDKDHVAVTLKHFAGHGQSEGGRNIAPVNHSERYFRETHLYPFEMAIKRANAWRGTWPLLYSCESAHTRSIRHPCAALPREPARNS